MAEMPIIDPNFAPQPRPRSGTWPLNRPNIEPQRKRGQGVHGMILGATLEESNSQEMLSNDPDILSPAMTIKEDYLSLLSPDPMLTQSDLDSVLIGSPTVNLVTDFSAITPAIAKSEPTPSTNVLSDYCSSTTITELSNLSQSHNFKNRQGLPHSENILQENQDITAALSSPSNISLSKTSSPITTVSGSQLTTSTSGATPKVKSTRKNAWGNMSYADLITQAIEASPEQRLTLAQVYEWMVKNVPYFKDKGDSNSSAGWKNSIRHNLSLHSKFKRIQNEGTGKSSWWVINHDAKPGKSPRRRAISMDNANAKYNRSRNKALAKQKAELIKKQKAGLKSGQSGHGESSTWGRDGLETPISKALGSEYRPRASSNASSLGGRMSPPHGIFLTMDLEDDGAPPLSPLSGSNNNLANLSTSLPSAFNNIFDIVPQDNSPSTIPEGIPTDQMLHDNLLESLASMDVVSSPASYQCEQSSDSKDVGGVYMLAESSLLRNSNNLNSKVAQNSPNLANLLQGKCATKNVATKDQKKTMAMKPQAYGIEEQKTIPFPYEYQTQQICPLQTSSQSTVNEGKPLYHYAMSPQNTESSMYGQESQVPPQSQQVIYMQQQPGLSTYMATQPQPQQPQLFMQNQLQMNRYSSSAASNLTQMNQAKFPSDINLDNQELFDSGEMDLNEVLRDIPSPDYATQYNFNMDFDSKNTGNYFTGSNHLQMPQLTDVYNIGLGGANRLQSSMCPQQPPEVLTNADPYVPNAVSGNLNNMGMMASDGLRAKNSNLQHLSQNQTSSIGARYGMQ